MNIETTSFELNYTSKNLNNYHVYKETDTKQERNHKKKMNQKMSKDSDTIEVRQSNGNVSVRTKFMVMVI